MFLLLYISVLLLVSPIAGAELLQWSNTELQYLHGEGYQAPGNSNDISQSIITFTHADGWAFGRNFLFMDTLMTDAGQPGQISVYGEAYSYLSLSKLTGKDLSVSIVKDVNATVGVNAGENFDSVKSGTRIFLYGFTIDFKLPGFKLFNIDFIRHDVLDPVELGPSWQMTPVWKLPFTIAGLKWSFEGFADFIEGKNSRVVYNILAQPQLRLDIGDFWGQAEQVYVGIEYQYWHNKYGIKDFHESLPQALVVLKF